MQKHPYAPMQESSTLGRIVTDQLTPKAQAILDVLSQTDGWLKRSELAARLTKIMLNKWDIVLLGKLTDAGLIETRQVPRHGPIGYEWQYRAVSKNEC